MGKRGRPIKGTDNIANLPGSADAKYRLEVIMDSISGKLTVAKACAKLGVGKSAFYRMREKALSGALASLEPQEAGRPRTPDPTPEEEYITELEHTTEHLRRELEASQIREELAISMPQAMSERRERQQAERERRQETARRKAAKKRRKNKQARQARKSQKKRKT